MNEFLDVNFSTLVIFVFKLFGASLIVGSVVTAVCAIINGMIGSD